MSNVQVSYVDLSNIVSAVNSISNGISVVDHNVNILHNKQDVLENDLATLSAAFAEFVEMDIRQKNLQLAETRVGNLKQDLQIKYGYYAEIRRMATGILQGVDTGIIGEDTLKFTTEEVMLKAPGYWLAPALICTSSWIRNDKSNCDKALKESLKRDDYKSTIFFMLLMRRLMRNEASLKWLERYFMHQDARDLDREFIVILEAVTTGVFSPAGKQLMMNYVSKWLDQLTESDNFVNEQRDRWLDFFYASPGVIPPDKYILLKKYTHATNWNDIEQSIQQVKTHNILKTFFNNIFTRGQDFSHKLIVQLDQILSLLVTNFDDEELPLQQQVRLNELIIEYDGDKKYAQAKMNAEMKIFQEKVDFLQLLTNASFNPEKSGATKLTQALAVSISLTWIVEAYDKFVGQIRSKVPTKINIVIDDWKGDTQDGKNEKELLESQNNFYDNILRSELTKISSAVIIIGIVMLVGGILLMISAPVFGALVGLIGGIMASTSYSNRKKKIESINESIEKRRKDARNVLSGVISDIVEYRNELKIEDVVAEEVRSILKSITPSDFSVKSEDTKRNLI